MYRLDIATCPSPQKEKKLKKEKIPSTHHSMGRHPKTTPLPASPAIYIYIYMYTQRQRQRQRQTDTDTDTDTDTNTHACIYMSE
jgi:hypothetical protein